MRHDFRDRDHPARGPHRGSRHPQAIAQFAVRNKAEIAVIQAGHNKALHERLAAIPIADQARRIAVNGLLRDDILDLLQVEDPHDEILVTVEEDGTMLEERWSGLFGRENGRKAP